MVDTAGKKRANGRDESQNLALAALLHNLANFLFQLLQVVQCLFYHQAVLSGGVLDPDTLRGELLDLDELGFRGMISLFDCSEIGWKVAAAIALRVGNCSRRSKARAAFGSLKTWVNSGKVHRK